MLRFGLVVAILAVLAQRAEILPGHGSHASIMSYEITGFQVGMPRTDKPPLTLVPPAPPGRGFLLAPTGWSLTIRYADNLGVEFSDIHAEGTDAEPFVKTLFLTPTPGALSTRLLQHLIDEGKIGPSRIVRTP